MAVGTALHKLGVHTRGVTAPTLLPLRWPHGVQTGRTHSISEGDGIGPGEVHPALQEAREVFPLTSQPSVLPSFQEDSVAQDPEVQRLSLLKLK